MISINYFSKHGQKHGDGFEAYYRLLALLNASAIQRKMVPFAVNKKRPTP